MRERTGAKASEAFRRTYGLIPSVPVDLSGSNLFSKSNTALEVISTSDIEDVEFAIRSERIANRIVKFKVLNADTTWKAITAQSCLTSTDQQVSSCDCKPRLNLVKADLFENMLIDQANCFSFSSFRLQI